MSHDISNALLAFAEEKSMQKKTVSYLAECLKPFVEPGEAVLICAPEPEERKLSPLLEQAVTLCGGSPVIWGEDPRWKTLLRLAFTTRATTIIGAPLVILGLSKLKKANAIPLFIKHVVTTGYPCFDWMREGIEKGFDCISGECFGPWDTGLVAGFSCVHSRGVHLWSEEYDISIRDDAGHVLPEGQDGRWVLSPKERSEVVYCPGDFGRLDLSPCPCGNPAPRVMNMRPLNVEAEELAELGQYLHSWTSVLDCDIRRGPFGLEIEMVIFPGEKLPKLPTCAKQVIRAWDPETDKPIPFVPWHKNNINFTDSH